VIHKNGLSYHQILHPNHSGTRESVWAEEAGDRAHGHESGLEVQQQKKEQKEDQPEREGNRAYSVPSRIFLFRR
jgi:hypothetical protein